MSGIEHELERQAAAIRRLAAVLVRDANTADDLTQDTLQRGLTHAPEGAGVGWFRRTLGNFVQQWRRGGRRQQAREAAVRPPEPPPTPLQALVHREALANVTAAVLQLAEPYQATILLRYFEDLSPTEIAARTGSNLATVKSRLQRGLLLLRERLDRRGHGDWRLGLTTAFGLPALTTAASTTLTTSTFSFGTGLAALVLLGLGGAWWLTRAPGHEPAAAASATRGASRSTHPIAASTPDAAPAPPLSRTTAIASPTLPAWLAHPFLMQLDVRVVDELGLPVRGHSLQAAPIDGVLRGVFAPTDHDGRTTLRLYARQPRVAIELELPNGARRRVSLDHGQATALTVATFPAAAAASSRGLHVQLLGDLPVLGVLFDGAPTSIGMGPSLHPFLVLADPGAVAAPTGGLSRDRHEPPAQQLRLVGPLRFTPTPYVRDFDLGTDATPPGRLDGLVLGADGLPARELPVALLGADGEADVRRTTTDGDGHFTFAGLPSGTFTMHAGGDARGLASMTTTVTGGPRTATLVLQRGATLQGRVEAARGDLTALVVEWRADDDSWSDAVRVAADGSFTFANLPHQRGTLLLWGPAGGLPLAQEREVLCDNGEVRLRLPTAATMRTWSITPVVTTNDLPPRLLLHEPATGFTLALGAPEAGGLWSTRLRPGAYELLAPNGAGHGSLFWVSGDADVDAGKLELPPPGELHFEVPEPLRSHADASVELFALRDDFDRLVARGGDELLLPQFVPAGEYGLVCRDATGALRFGRVHVAAGERATLRLDDPTACR